MKHHHAVGISIILATYNGQLTLPRTLKALSELSIPECGVEFLLVDNASTDGTATLLQDFLAEYPGTYIYENRPGKSWALNAGLERAAGELIIFTDDDVIPCKEWLEEYLLAMNTYREAAAFAGQIRLLWPSRPTKWLRRLEETGRTLGATPLDRQDGPVAFGDVKGANCAIRAKWVREGLRFDPHLGVSSQGPLVAGEEIAFMREIIRKGGYIQFVSSAHLLHIVRPHQMKLRSLLKRDFRNGRGEAILMGHEVSDSNLTIFGFHGYMIRQGLRGVFRSFTKLLSSGVYDTVIELLSVSQNLGFMVECKRMRATVNRKLSRFWSLI